MPELLLELFSEEIPARMQGRAAEDLRTQLVDGLKSAGIVAGASEALVTPRRLTVIVADVPAQSADISEERKGPRVGAPQAAIAGFLKSTGFQSLDEAELVSDAKKGDYYIARTNKPGRTAAAILAELVPGIIERFAWPKSMRWGSGRLRWVRPLKSIICLHGGAVVPMAVHGIASGATTLGHRFLSDGAITVTGVADYRAKLAAAKVMLSPADRAALIREQAISLAKAAKLELVEDEGLLAENAGLVEWPQVLIGSFEADFLAVPGDVLTTAIRAHQKCFSLRDPKTGKLANRFLLTSNLIAADGGTAIIAGNEKVIRARLSDARFFWDQDLQRPLDDMWSALRSVTFHDQLGSQHDRIERIAMLAESLAEHVGADPVDARRAAQLAKADLVSGVVGEFPELQGLMGRYYAEAAGTKPAIANAIEQHYWPRGAGDAIPTAPESIAVGLADRLDTLVGFWAINEKPTGSKDPFGLRRAALASIRIILENGLRLPLVALASAHRARFVDLPQAATAPFGIAGNAAAVEAIDLLGFFTDRLKVYLRDQGARHDLIDAVLGDSGGDDLLMVVRRVEALGGFLATDDGASLLAGAKRAANILRIEEKKDSRSYAGTVNAALLTDPAEQALDAAISASVDAVGDAVEREDFAAAMTAMAALRAPVDSFFDKVTVNADDAATRANRLALLARIRAATLTVADFSKIAG